MTIKKSIIITSVLLVLGMVYACHTPTKIAIELNDTQIKPIFPLAEVCFPVLDMVIPYTPLPIEEISTDKNVTLAFSYKDKNHVRSNDPKLFVGGDVEIIDLPYLSEADYAFPLPGAKMISPYAGRRKNHSGTDLKTIPNDTIISAFDGVVRMAKGYAAYGNVVVVRHYNGLETIYSHNSKNLVKPGDVVKAGTPLALVGRTGRATTEHLHFEVRINGQHFNPDLIFNFETGELQNKTLLCTIKNNRIDVSAVDPFPYFLARMHAKDPSSNQIKGINLN